MCDTKGSMKKHAGFTLLEILIVVTIIILLAMVLFMNLRGQTARANDIKRKSDIYILSKFFEDYRNDNDAFPNQSVVNNCAGAMEPYIKRIPCDPVSKTHYGYFPSVNGGYRICAKLSDTTDPAIAAMNCGGAAGCGLGSGYNFCLASGVTASAVGTVDEIIGGGTPTPGGGGGTPTPGGGGGGGGGTPTPTLNPVYHISCTLGGDCNWYDDPSLHGCPVSWEINCPAGACAIIANRCAD